MDFICDLDWGIIKDILGALISAGIPSLVAWLIYQGWKSQKGSEVIVSEIQKDTKILLKMIVSSTILLDQKLNPDEYYEECLNISRSYEDLTLSILYIMDCVEIPQLKKEFDNFVKRYKEFNNDKMETKPNFFNKNFMNGFNIKVTDFRQSSMDLLNILIPYSTYQKNFDFKHK